MTDLLSSLPVLGPSAKQKAANAAAGRLAVLLGGAGVLHFAAPGPFDGQVPRALPGEPRTYTYVSGAVELALAAGLTVPRTRRVSGLAAAAFFVAVFPANIQMAMIWLASEKTSTAMKIGVIARLPLQIPLITEARKVHRHAR